MFVNHLNCVTEALRPRVDRSLIQEKRAGRFGTGHREDQDETGAQQGGLVGKTRGVSDERPPR